MVSMCLVHLAGLESQTLRLDASPWLPAGVAHPTARSLAADTWDVEVVAIPYGRHGWAAHTQPIPAVAASPRPALANPRAAATGAAGRAVICWVVRICQGLSGSQSMLPFLAFFFCSSAARFSFCSWWYSERRFW